MNSFWGGEVVLSAASKLFQKDIQIFQSSSPMLLYESRRSTGVLKLLFRANHYDSVIQVGSITSNTDLCFVDNQKCLAINNNNYLRIDHKKENVKVCSTGSSVVYSLNDPVSSNGIFNAILHQFELINYDS